LISLLLSLAGAGYVPPLPQTVVYEANLRAFGPHGGFNALTGRLDSLKKIGVNVLWLMPIQPVGKLRSAGGLGSPYAVADYDSINPEFGSADDFKHLIAEAHRRKIAVIIDWVANHTAWDHPWIKSHPDWYTHDASGQITIPAGTNWQDTADLDFGKPPLHTAMIAAMKGWVDRYGIDGFRCDTADWVPAEFWKEAIGKLRASTPKPLFMLAEGFRADHYAAGFDLTYGWPFYDRLCAIYKGAKATELAGAAANEAKGIPLDARRLRFTSNHDKSAWEGTPLDYFGSPEGVRTAFTVNVLYGGTPLIYQGQEVAWPKRIPMFENSTIDWSGGGDTGKWMASLLGLRRKHPSLLSGVLQDFSSDDAIVFVRRQGNDEALVVANVRSHATTISLPATARGTWREGFSGKGATLAASLTLPPYACAVYTRSPKATQ